MPIKNGKYAAPIWVDNGPPALDAAELQAISDSVASYADPAERIAGIVRPNLLANWYFVGGGSQQNGGEFPINSKGATSYSHGQYCIDGWYNRYSMTASLLSTGLKLQLTASGPYPYLSFDVASVDELKGKKVTISFVVSEVSTGFKGVRATINQGNNVWAIGGIGTNDVATGYATTTGLYTATGTLSTSNLYSRFFFSLRLDAYSRASGDYCVISAVKMEVGDTQTLAHQESGAWVLNETPNFDEEFMKCAVLPSVPSKIEYGSYVGTGTYGSSSPNVLTFGFVPKTVFVKDETASLNYMIAVAGCTSTRGISGGTNSQISLTWSGTSLKWYASNTFIQLNFPNENYYYVAIG